MNPFGRSPKPWRLIAFVATAVACAALLFPGRGEGEVTARTFFSLPTDLSDVLEIGAHFLIFSLLTHMWYRAFSSSGYALTIAVLVLVPLGIATEFAQSLVYRGVSFFDLLANLFAIALTASLLRRRK